MIVGSGKTAERENVLKPEYGKIVGGIEEIDPSAATAIINNPDHRTRNFARNMKVQFLDSDFPGLTMNCLSYAGPYVVFAVTNNGLRTVYSEVRRFVTISSGQHEDFTSVAIPAGETLTRVFRMSDMSGIFGGYPTPVFTVHTVHYRTPSHRRRMTFPSFVRREP